MKTIICIVSIILCGCATGITMTDAEAAACRASGCTVWTEQELYRLAEIFFRKGQDSVQTGKAI